MKQFTDTVTVSSKRAHDASQTIWLCRAGVFAALVCVVTYFIQIPIPLGYFNVGNCVILTGCLIFPMPYGIAAASIGSALADLLSYPVYTVPTLLIKALMPFVFYVIAGKKSNHPSVRTLAAGYIATLIPLFGYTLTGGIICGSLSAGLAQFLGLLLEYIANAVLFSGAFFATKPIRRNTVGSTAE